MAGGYVHQIQVTFRELNDRNTLMGEEMARVAFHTASENGLLDGQSPHHAKFHFPAGAREGEHVLCTTEATASGLFAARMTSNGKNIARFEIQYGSQQFSSELLEAHEEQHQDPRAFATRVKPGFRDPRALKYKLMEIALDHARTYAEVLDFQANLALAEIPTVYPVNGGEWWWFDDLAKLVAEEHKLTVSKVLKMRSPGSSMKMEVAFKLRGIYVALYEINCVRGFDKDGTFVPLNPNGAELVPKGAELVSNGVELA